MSAVYLSVKNILKPQVLTAEKDFLIVYKPPRMHSAPLARSPSDNLLGWCTRKFPEIAELPGRRAGEGGLLHRLDFETQGLLLMARTQRTMDALIEQQMEGDIVKEYCALASAGKTLLPGFPLEKPAHNDPAPFSVKSAFRAFGYGRKAVRPVMTDEAHRDIVLDGGNPYITEIIETRPLPHGVTFLRLKIYRGFRHQIRCHLAWMGLPILNDDLYGGLSFGKGLLALRANSISLIVPSSGIRRTYSIPPLALDDI